MSKFTCPECCLSVGHAPDCQASKKPDLVLPTPRTIGFGEALFIEQAAKSAKESPAVDAHAEPAPESSLPNWSECSRIIENHEFRQRAAAGLEGQVLDTPAGPEPTELHRFIYEYDDADAYRSAWFMHRLERVIAEAKAAPASPASAPVDERAAFEAWHNKKFRWMSARCSILSHNYADQRTQERWETWQARAALAAPVEQAGVPLTDEKIYEWAEGYQFSCKGNPHKMTFSRPRFIQAVRTILSHSLAHAAPLPPVVARKDGAA